MTPELSPAQLTALAAAINASTDPNIINWRSPLVGDDGSIAAYYNALEAPVVKAWRSSVSARDLYEAMNMTTYDSVAALSKPRKVIRDAQGRVAGTE